MLYYHRVLQESVGNYRHQNHKPVNISMYCHSFATAFRALASPLYTMGYWLTRTWALHVSISSFAFLVLDGFGPLMPSVCRVCFALVAWPSAVPFDSSSQFLAFFWRPWVHILHNFGSPSLGATAVTTLRVALLTSSRFHSPSLSLLNPFNMSIKGTREVKLS